MEDIPFGPRAMFGDELRDAILEQFSLGTIIAIKDLGGTYNLNILLRTTLGTYVVRVYRPWVTYERLAMTHQVKQVLYENAFPVVLPIAGKGGETLFSLQGRYGEVEHFIPHDEVTETWARYETAFSLLAGLHDCLATRLEHIPFVPPQVSNYGTPDVLFTWMSQVEQRIVQMSDDTMKRSALALCVDTMQLLTVMKTKWNETGHALPQQVTHGDYGFGNILFRDECIVAILDFDFLAVRERIFDLAYTLYWMFHRIEGGLSPANLSWSRVRDMLTRYNSTSTRPLTGMEVRTLPLEIARVPLYWVAEAHVLSDPARTIMQLADTVQYSRWVLENSDELANLFVL